MNHTTQLWCVRHNPCSWQEGPSAAPWAFDIPFIPFNFFSAESPSSLQCEKGIRKKSRKLTSKSSWSKETGGNSKSLEKRKERKGLWKLVTKIPEEEKILGLAGSCLWLDGLFRLDSWNTRRNLVFSDF